MLSIAAAQDRRVERVVICIPDKNLAQCVRGTSIVQLNRRTRVIIDEAGVVQKFGVSPESIPAIRTRVWRHSNAAGPHHRRVQYQSAAWRAFGRVWCYPSRNKARICKGARVGRVHAPFAAIIRDRLEMNEFGQHRSRRFRAPAR